MSANHAAMPDWESFASPIRYRPGQGSLPKTFFLCAADVGPGLSNKWFRSWLRTI
jgi:hypothetical protein